ncbi:methyltransferase domain-containing protein [Flavobacterium sp. 3HN19-14]|uniref:methyltransferase domain-containing protein n=1 Tax=Flavobacterium sp. 3HN19-14 TaxID=3448133 RepID=UPI003EE26386
MKDNLNIYLTRSYFADAMLDKYFPDAPNKVVSDIGAGFGHMRAKVNSLEATWQPFDYVRKIEEATIWDLNENHPESARKAGTVIFLEVLEHLANPLLGLQNIAAHMEAGSFLILTTPNPASSINRVDLLLKGRLYAFQEKHLEEHHVFTPWLHIVKFFLEQCGFEILEYGVVDVQHKGKSRFTIKHFIRRKIESTIEYFDPYAQGMSYGLVARKKS